MVMLPVLENPVIQNDIAGFRKKALFPLVILYPSIATREFFPGDTACQMAGFAFIRPDGNLKARLPAAIVYKRSAPQPVSFFKRPARKKPNDRFKIGLLPFYTAMKRDSSRFPGNHRQVFSCRVFHGNPVPPNVPHTLTAHICHSLHVRNRKMIRGPKPCGFCQIILCDEMKDQVFRLTIDVYPPCLRAIYKQVIGGASVLYQLRNIIKSEVYHVNRTIPVVGFYDIAGITRRTRGTRMQSGKPTGSRFPARLIRKIHSKIPYMRQTRPYIHILIYPDNRSCIWVAIDTAPSGRKLPQQAIARPKSWNSSNKSRFLLIFPSFPI